MGAVQNYVAVSRRPPDVEDYIDMLRRHRSWIIGPTYAGLVIAVVVAFFWPDTFESSAILRVTPQVVSQRIVADTLDLQMVQLLDSLRTKILSRTFLTTLIANDKLKLYPRLVQHYTMEDAIAQMQKDVMIQPAGLSTGGSGRPQAAFLVKFRYPDKYKAKAVVEALVTEFVNQNVTIAGESAKETKNFLADQLKDAKDRLDTIQTNIVKFREENAGRLPENAIYNANQLAQLQNRIGADDERINSLQMDRRNMQNTLQSNEDLLTYMTTDAQQAAPAQERVNQDLTNLDKEIDVEEATLAALKITYHADFPAVKQQVAKINSLKQKRDQEAAKQEEQAKQAPKIDKPAPALSVQQAANLQAQKDRIQAIQTQIENLDHEIQRTNDAKAEIDKERQLLQAKIEASPEVEQRYNELTQDLNFAKGTYDDLIRKENESETTQNIQERHLGEQLEVLDPASLPGNPVEPNRWVISGVGIGMGLMLGLVMAGAKEAKDTSLKNLKDVRAYTNLPVLSSIPLLENALLVRRKRRLFWLAWTTAIIAGSAAMFIAMTYYMTPRGQ
jgi:polysaccharide chain length determinant protein (PEP-CTERM system associated)